VLRAAPIEAAPVQRGREVLSVVSVF